MRINLRAAGLAAIITGALMLNNGLERDNIAFEEYVSRYETTNETDHITSRAYEKNEFFALFDDLIIPVGLLYGGGCLLLGKDRKRE